MNSRQRHTQWELDARSYSNPLKTDIVLVVKWKSWKSPVFGISSRKYKDVYLCIFCINFCFSVIDLSERSWFYTGNSIKQGKSCKD